MVVDIEWDDREPTNAWLVLFWAKGKSVRVKIPSELASDGKVRSFLHWMTHVIRSAGRP